MWALKAELDALSPPVRLVCLVHEHLPAQVAEFRAKFWPGDIFLDGERKFYKVAVVGG